MKVETTFAPETAAGIVTHMNEDHADAVLAIARAHGGIADATAARLLAITPRSLEFEVEREGDRQAASVAFDPPIEPLDTVRARLVAMTKEARAALVASATVASG